MKKVRIECTKKIYFGEGNRYYESLHEVPLIANLIARKKLYEMNVVISDTAEYGNYLFSQAAVPLLKAELMPSITTKSLPRPCIFVNFNSITN